jgi:hypothetical protein
MEFMAAPSDALAMGPEHTWAATVTAQRAVLTRRITLFNRCPLRAARQLPPKRPATSFKPVIVVAAAERVVAVVDVAVPAVATTAMAMAPIAAVAVIVAALAAAVRAAVAAADVAATAAISSATLVTVPAVVVHPVNACAPSAER